MRSLTFTLLLASLAACGDSGGASTTTGNESSTGDASTVALTDTSTGDITSGTTDAPTTGSGSATGSETSATTGPADTSTGEDPSSTGAVVTDTTAVDETTGSTGVDTTTGATSDMTIAIVDAYLHANCQPPVANDPVYGEFYVEYDNTAGAGATEATLLSATLAYAGDDPLVPQPFPIDPEASGPIGAGEYVSQKVNKLVGPALDACMHCDEFYVLELQYQEGDYIHHVTEDVTIPCVF